VLLAGLLASIAATRAAAATPLLAELKSEVWFLQRAAGGWQGPFVWQAAGGGQW